MLAGKIVKGLEVSHFNFPRILRNKVTTEAAETASHGLEHMPTKQDLVTTALNEKIVSAGAPCSPYRRAFGIEGFTEQVKTIAGSLEKKLSTYVRIIPENSKMTKPLVFEVGGEPFELFVDKTADNVTRARIKQFVPTNGVLKEQNSGTILDIEFDKNGTMVNGSLHIGNSRYSDGYRFSRTDKNMRRIDFENVYNGHSHNNISYRPSKGTEQWNPIKDKANRLGTELPQLSQEYLVDEPLGYLFFDLTRLKKSII